MRILSVDWLNDIERLIKVYAQAKANRVYLEEFRKSKKALLMRQAESEDPVRYKTGSSQEAYAYSHPDYLALLEGLQAATEDEEKHRWNLRQREWKFEQWRTEQATARAEMNLR